MSELLEQQAWLESLDAESRAQADSFIAILEKLGAEDPVSWVASEMREDSPQVVTFLFLHEVRTKFVNNFIDRTFENEEVNLHPFKVEDRGREAYDRLRAAGADPDDLELFARGMACTTAHQFIMMLDGVDESVTDDLENGPRWVLAEVKGSLREGELSGRCVDGLHESFGNLYPSDD